MVKACGKGVRVSTGAVVAEAVASAPGMLAPGLLAGTARSPDGVLLPAAGCPGEAMPQMQPLVRLQAMMHERMMPPGKALPDNPIKILLYIIKY
jgi:hypothetical protein